MTRSPSRKHEPPLSFSRLPGCGGFSAACRARFRLAVPVSPLRVGLMT